MLLASAPHLSRLTNLFFSPPVLIETYCDVLPALKHLTALKVRRTRRAIEPEEPDESLTAFLSWPARSACGAETRHHVSHVTCFHATMSMTVYTAGQCAMTPSGRMRASLCSWGPQRDKSLPSSGPYTCGQQLASACRATRTLDIIIIILKSPIP